MMERAIAEYIVNAIWQAPILAGGAWLLLWLVKPGPRTQHGIWIAVLALAVLLPLRAPEKTRAPAASLQATTVVKSGRTGQAPLHLNKLTRVVILDATAARWLARLYLATIPFALLRIARSWHTARCLVAHAQPAVLDSNSLALYSRRFGVRLPRLCQSAAVSSPVIVGVAEPVLLLPYGFTHFSEDEIAAALCHELAHVKRNDYLMNLVCQVAALPLAWHPAVAAVQQRIRLTREMICDAMAAQALQSHTGYARCLLSLAHNMLGVRARTEYAQFPGLFGNHTLEERIMRLTEKTTMSIQARLVRIASGAALAIATSALTVMFHVTPAMAEPQAGGPPQATEATSPIPSVTAPEAPAPPTPIAQEQKRHVVEERRIRRQIDESQRHMAKARALTESREFRQRMEDAQRQMDTATEILNSPEFKRQLENAQRQIATATAVLNSPQFRQQMEDAQRKVAQAAVIFDNPEFQRQMDHIRHQIQHEAEENSQKFIQPSSPIELAPTN